MRQFFAPFCFALALSPFVTLPGRALAGESLIAVEAKARASMPLPLIPMPRKAEFRQGTSDLANPRILPPQGVNDVRLDTAVTRLKEAFGSGNSGATIRLVLKQGAPGGAEGYTLKTEADGATVTASTPQGLLYGVTTLAQMSGLAQSARVPCAEITDEPTLGFRSVMHDIGRCYMSLDRLKRHIDILSRYKINIFHWHLTENPAWRFEVKSHPELTRAQFHEKPNSPGKFYSQQEIKDIIAYAKARGVIIVPEIDIPGHSAALRRALGVKSMDDPKVAPVLRDTFRELLALASPEDMPYIHMGSDEAHGKHEQMPDAFIAEIAKMITDSGRQAIFWRKGITPPAGDNILEMLWAQFKPSNRHRFIDARSIYTNLNTGADAVRTTYWNVPAKDGKPEHRFGGELAHWLDIPTEDENIERVTPFWPAVVTFADRAWHGGEFREDLLVTIPPEKTDEAKAYHAFENAIIAHRDAFFKGVIFPYVREDGFWKLLGPIPNGKKTATAFGPEKNWTKPDPVKAPDGKTYDWDREAYGWHIFLQHMFGWPGALDVSKPQTTPWSGSIIRRGAVKDSTVYARAVIASDLDKEVGFWIQFDTPNGSDRREGPNPKQGEWSNDGARVWVNGREVNPPQWKTPGAGSRFWPPLSDEPCFMRPVTKVRLKKGDNVVVVRLPQGGPKWEFVCHPVEWDGVNAREAKGVTFKKW